MSQPTQLQLTFAYHQWATKKLIDHCADFLPSDAVITKVPNVFPCLRDIFQHLLDVDRVWLSRLQGESPTSLEEQKNETFDGLRSSLEQLHTYGYGMIEKEGDGSRIVHYTNTKGELFRNTVLEIVLHMSNHGTYHRGNAASMIRQLGHSGVSTDYIYFLRSFKD